MVLLYYLRIDHALISAYCVELKPFKLRKMGNFSRLSLLLLKFGESKCNLTVGILLCLNVKIDKYTKFPTKLFTFIAAQIVDGNM